MRACGGHLLALQQRMKLPYLSATPVDRWTRGFSDLVERFIFDFYERLYGRSWGAVLRASQRSLQTWLPNPGKVTPQEKLLVDPGLGPVPSNLKESISGTLE